MSRCLAILMSQRFDSKRGLPHLTTFSDSRNTDLHQVKNIAPKDSRSTDCCHLSTCRRYRFSRPDFCEALDELSVFVDINGDPASLRTGFSETLRFGIVG